MRVVEIVYNDDEQGGYVSVDRFDELEYADIVKYEFDYLSYNMGDLILLNKDERIMAIIPTENKLIHSSRVSIKK
jgi:hypothetical protein